jgi:hypothetical protein
MNTGKLTNVEKYAIKGMVGEGKKATEIGKAIDRPAETVQKYIDGELDDICGKVAKARMKKYKDTDQPKETQAPVKKPYKRTAVTEKDLMHINPMKIKPNVENVDLNTVASAEIINEARTRLRDAGLIDTDINNLLNAALSTAAETGHTFPSVDTLFTACIRRMKAGAYMIKKTQGGNEGVAMMTPAASVRGDEAKKLASSKTSSRGNHIFNPKTGEVK